MARRYEERNAEARAKLEPLAEGERPRRSRSEPSSRALLAIVFTVSARPRIAGVRPGAATKPLPIIVFGSPLGDDGRHVAGPLLGRARLPDPAPPVDARQRFGLVVVSSVLQAVGTTLLLSGAGMLFYFMIRAMARIQMPASPEERS